MHFYSKSNMKRKLRINKMNINNKYKDYKNSY